METLKKVWNWLNGNKTFFGMLILLMLEQDWFTTETFLYQFLQWVGYLLAGTGVGHKLLKANTKPEPNL